LKAKMARVKEEVGKVIVGQEEVVDQVLVAIMTGGHCLMMGVPGLAKTLLVSTLSKVLDLKFKRVQFTPDLLPSDITGSEIIAEQADGSRKFEFMEGPLFANMLLADEINRTPPKTQAALLEAMQEMQVTVGGKRHKLEKPFFVLATQNPIEQEGTYPLPEAQLDRFMYMIRVGYPTEEEELEIMKLTTAAFEHTLGTVLSGEEILALQDLVRRVPVGDHVYNYALDITRATRPNEPGASDFVRHWLAWGAGPRSGQYLILAGKARALLHGRLYVTTEDIEAVTPPVLRHRLIPSFNAEAEGITVEQIIQKILTLTPQGKGERLL
jgi:MoxR-like ATPase